MKVYRYQRSVGKSRHVVSFHDGIKTHEDGSPFFDIRTFTRINDACRFMDALEKSGYVTA